MSTTSATSGSAASAASTAAQTIAAAQAAEQAAAQSIISGSTGSSVDVSALVTSIVGAKTAGATATLGAAATNDANTLSAYGTLQAALEAFQAGIAGLANGTAIQSYTTTASGSGLTATGGSGTSAGSYSIGVTQVASQQSLSSPAINPPTSALGTGTLNISLGGQSMSINVTSANNTLSGLVAAINNSTSNPGIQANIVTGTDGAHLVLRSTTTGAANTINVTVGGDTSGDALSTLGVTSAQGTDSTGASTIVSSTPGSPWTQTTPAEDTHFTINGTAGTSSTTTITAVQGLTINVTAAAIGTPAGTPQTLTVAQNTSGATTAINSFVSLYNTLVTTYNTVGGFDSTQAPGQQGGPLNGNSTLNTIQNSLANIISGGVKNGNTSVSLATLGITMNQDGTLTANTTATATTTTIAAALSSNLSGVIALFNPTTGIGAQLNNSLTKFLDPNNGQLANSMTAVQADQASIAKQQGALATYTAQLTNQYQAEFTALNSLMATTNNNSQYLTQLFGGANSAGAYATASSQ